MINDIPCWRSLWRGDILCMGILHMKKNSKIPEDMQKSYMEFQNEKDLFQFPEEWENDIFVIQQEKTKRNRITFFLVTCIIFSTFLIQMVEAGMQFLSLAGGL